MRTVAMEKSILNDAWNTNEEMPDPDVLPKVPGFHILEGHRNHAENRDFLEFAASAVAG